MRARGLFDLPEIRVRPADDVPEPGALRRCAFPEKAERLVRLHQRFAWAAEIAEGLRRPGECAREALGVASAAKLFGRVAVVREGALVVAADAMQNAAQQDDPRQPPLRAGREPVEPALQRGDLAAVKGALAVVAHQLRRAPMISGLLEVMDRAVHVAACRGALGVAAVQIDDLGRREKLSRTRAQELREERLEAMASLRAVAHHQARLLQSGEELAGRTTRAHVFVVFDALEQRPSQNCVLIAAGRAPQDLGIEVGVELRSAPLELAELLPPALAHERGGEAQPGGPAASA